MYRVSRAPSALLAILSYTSTKVCNGVISVALGEDVDNVCSLLKEQLEVSSMSLVEELDIDYSGVVAFGIGHSQALFTLSLCQFVSSSCVSCCGA